MMSSALEEVEPPAADKHGDHEPKFQGRSRDVEKELSECMEEVEVRNSHIAHLVSSNKELSDTLQQRDQQIIAYQNEANAMERRNRDLESKIRDLEPNLSKLQQRDHQFVALQNEANAIERRNRELESKIRDLEPIRSKLQQRDHQIVALQNEANAIERRNRVLESKIRDLEPNLSKLQQREQQIIALQNEANAKERRNRVLESKVRELESKLSHFKSTPGGKRKDEESERPKELNEHVKKQSMMIVDLRRERETLSSETSQDKMKIQELEDERDKLQEDFESAREAMEQLKQEKRSLLDGKYVPQAEDYPARMTPCDKPKGKSRQRENPPQQQVLACDSKEETSSSVSSTLDRSEANRKKHNQRSHEVSGQSNLDNQRKPITAESQNVPPPIPPRKHAKDTFTQNMHVPKDQALSRDNRPQAEEGMHPQDAGTSSFDEDIEFLLNL